MSQTSFFLPATESTPEVKLDDVACTLSLRGESYPENVSDFYGPILELIEARNAAGKPTHAKLALDYLNTSSTKAILDLLDLLDAFSAQGGSASVEWITTSETMREAGEDLLTGLTLPCSIVDEPQNE